MLAVDLNQCLNLPFRPVNHFPECPAVYVIYATPDIVLYIGAAKSLRNRLQGHGPLVSVGDLRCAWFPLPSDLHRSTERQLIRILRPVLNCHHVPKGAVRIHYLRSKEIQCFIQTRRRLISRTSNRSGEGK